MSSRGIKIKEDDDLLTGWSGVKETAPSAEVKSPPVFFRALALAGLFLTVLGSLAMLAPYWQQSAVIRPGVGFIFSCLGVFLLLLHAFVDDDIQYRRTYAGFGLLAIFGGVGALVIPASAVQAAPMAGLGSLMLGLVMTIASAKLEPDGGWRQLQLRTVLFVGAGLTVFFLVQGFMNPASVTQRGAVFLLVGVVYLASFLSLQPGWSNAGYYAGLAMGAVGLLTIVAVIVRSMTTDPNFFIPAGLTLAAIGALHVVIAVGACSDWQVAVLARRELASYFLSPIAYLVLIGNAIMMFLSFFQFTAMLLMDSRGGAGMAEPILGPYIFSLIPVILQLFLVPVITMRTLSEEHRTGTLEVMFTAPVEESSLVLGKFLGAWIFYLLNWIPAGLFLVSLRVYSGESFSILTLLTFSLTMLVTGAEMIAMGLFFSSLTRNQMAAAVLSFASMIFLLFLFFAPSFQGVRERPALVELFESLSFLHAWDIGLSGSISPRHLLVHGSVAAYFVFLTVKVLQSRKWR